MLSDQIKMVHVVLFSLCLCHLDGVFAGTDAVKSVSVTEGDSVSLNSDLTDMMDDDLIYWRFGDENTVIAEIIVLDDRMTVYEDVLDGRFRDRLKLDHQTGSLTITHTTTEHTGVYTLEMLRNLSKSFNLTVYSEFNIVLNNPISNQTTHLDINTLCHTCAADTRSPYLSPVSLIVLISAAGSLIIVAVVVGIFCICRRLRKIDGEVQTHDEEIIYADPTFCKRKAHKLNIKEENDVVYAGIALRR